MKVPKRLAALLGIALALGVLGLLDGTPHNAATAESRTVSVIGSDPSGPGSPSLSPRATVTEPKPPSGSSANAALIARPVLEPAANDPFLADLAAVAKPSPSQQTRPPVAKVTTPAPLPPATVQPVEAPTAPPLMLAFSGRMRGPDGVDTVYVRMGEVSVAAKVGQKLPNGYRVDAIHEHHMELSYPSPPTTARLDLPAAPRYEIR